MIDLRNKGLPKTVDVCGSPFLIKTDFREWLKFGEIIKNECTLQDLEFLFVDKVPLVDFSPALVEFYANKNSTPNYENNDNQNILDYIQDGEYIVASFMAEYGIDLTSVDSLHWHLFKALFLGLSERSKIKTIMSYRSYETNNKKEDQVRKELKKAWTLPDEENQSNLDELRKEMEEYYKNKKVGG